MPSRRQILAAAASSLAAVALDALPASPAELTGPAARGGGRHGVGAESAQRAPNIVLIAADDLGYGEVGAYGQRLMETPHLDRLAAEGTRFTQAYSAAAVCAPSRCSLLTGLHAGHAAVRENPFGGGPQGALGASDTTFAELLHGQGYGTACIGKWGFGPEEAAQPSHPNARGFDEFLGYIDHRHAHDYFPDYLWHNGERRELAAGTYAIDEFERAALAYIRERARARRPFLLYLSPNTPHAPSDIPETDAAWTGYADRPWSAANRGHAAQVSRLDRLVGSVVDELRRRGIERDTLVLVTSDNGPHEEGGTDPDLFDANGPLRGYKRNLYEGGIRVPLLAWRPGTVAAGEVNDRVTPQTDVLPTLTELAGLPAPPGVDGLSAAALLDGSGGSAPEHQGGLYWYRNDPGSTPRANAEEGGRIDRLAEAVRRGDWKAVRYAPGRERTAPDSAWGVELYDLAADPGETTDVAAEHPALVAELTAVLRASWA